MLQFLGNRIKSIGELLPSDAHTLEQLILAERDLNTLNAELAHITDLNVADIYAICDKVARDNLDFAKIYYSARNLGFIPFDENAQVRRLARAIATQTADTYVNLSKTAAYAIRDKQTGTLYYPSVSQQYFAAVDQAVQNISLGFETYQTQMRSVLKEMADSGIRTVYYSSGVHRRLDSAARMNILDGMRQVGNEVQKQVGEEFGADGVEISVHAFPAPDHEDIQGHQYSFADFDALNNSLNRPIGTCNCYHQIFTIVLGVSPPTFSDEELEEIKRKNAAGIEFEGKHYTMYEATQMQRKLESAIRTAKDEHIAASAAGDKLGTDQAQQKITVLKRKYADFSNAAGLSVKADRLVVDGYRASKVTALANDVKNSYNILTDNEQYAIKTYVGSEGFKINPALREGLPLSEYQQSVVRDLDSALDKLPDYKGIVYRSVSSENIPDMDLFNAEHSEESTVKYLQFISTSKDVYDENMDIQMIIKSETAKDISKYNPKEKEVLFRRGARFKILKRKGNKIWMKEL